jgi:uncharacterized protein DUF4154
MSDSRQASPLWLGLWLLRWRFLMGALVVGFATTAAADEADALENQVKAAYLYRMAEYVEWPGSAFPDADAPIRIAVVGAEPLAGVLARMLVGRTANNRPFVVKTAKVTDNFAGVHILFIGRQEAGSLKQLLGSLKSQPVLTVSDVPGALPDGSVVNLVQDDNRIGFEISMGVAERNGLKLSSRLLAVAKRVEREVPR